MNTKEKLKKLRKLMSNKNIDAVIIPSADYHQSEYVAQFFQSRAYISGFDGSAGTVVITQKEAGCWTDGRYFVQAEKQLKGSGIDLYRMGEENTLTIQEFIIKYIPKKGCFAFDARVISGKQYDDYVSCCSKKEISIVDIDLMSELWDDRPAFPNGQLFTLGKEFSGKKVKDKIKDIVVLMKENSATVCLLSKLEDIAWLLNVRGQDVECTPVFYSYCMIKDKKVRLYVDETKINTEVSKSLKEDNVEIAPYECFVDDVKQLTKETIWIDKAVLNAQIVRAIDESNQVIDKDSPCMLPRAIKNKVEIKNMKEAHVVDGVALTRFIYWLKTTIGKEVINEYQAGEVLEQYRRQQPNFIEPSFHTIFAYGSNAAMMHYRALKNNNSELKTEGLVLIDSGGQYKGGTTDVTRTIVCGKIDDMTKKYYTRTLQGMIRLSKVKFLYGCTGQVLDVLSRSPLWDIEMDYKCGTGHGVGFCLSVHEGPQSFRWQPLTNVSAKLEEGMVITIEPGVYIPNVLGIRIENQVVISKGIKNEYGQFMHFDVMTLVPIDLDAIVVEELADDELAWLNDYHQLVYKKISPYCTPIEKAWLKMQTRKVVR